MELVGCFKNNRMFLGCIIVYIKWRPENGKKSIEIISGNNAQSTCNYSCNRIVIMGALLIKTLVKNNSLKDSKKTTNGKEIVTEAGDENDPTFKNGDGENSGSDDSDESGSVASTDAKILVINATGTSGVAGAWKTALEGKGYTSVEVGTYTQSAIATSKVCVSGSYDGADLAAELTSPEMSTVDSVSASDCDVSIDGYDIIVIIGTSDIKN